MKIVIKGMTFAMSMQKGYGICDNYNKRYEIVIIMITDTKLGIFIMRWLDNDHRRNEIRDNYDNKHGI